MNLCPSCNIPLQHLMKRRDKYTLLNCPECHLITCTPQPTTEEIIKYYKGYLFNLPKESKIKEKEQEIEKNVARIIEDIKKYKKENCKLLDVGGGTGLYAQAFAKSGYNVTLIDIDSQSCAYVQKKYGNILKVIEGDALKNNFPEKYDIIFCNQIIEHYPDVNSFLTKIEHLLAQDGLLILTTPNQDTIEYLVRPKWVLSYIFMVTRFHLHHIPKALWKFLKTPWLCCDPPRHIYAFNPKNMSNLCNNNKLNIKEIWTEYSTSQYYSPEKYTSKNNKNLFTIIPNIIARISLSCIQKCDQNKMRGSNLIIFCTKKSKEEIDEKLK